MIKKINSNKYGVVEYAVSTEDEIAQLPYLVGQGSVAIVIQTGNVYMFDEDDMAWHSLATGEKVEPMKARQSQQEVEAIHVVAKAVSTPLVVEEVKEVVVEQPMAKAPKKVKKASKKTK